MFKYSPASIDDKCNYNIQKPNEVIVLVIHLLDLLFFLVYQIIQSRIIHLHLFKSQIIAKCVLQDALQLAVFKSIYNMFNMFGVISICFIVELRRLIQKTHVCTNVSSSYLTLFEIFFLIFILLSGVN